MTRGSLSRSQAEPSSTAGSKRRQARRKAFELLFELEQHPGLSGESILKRSFSDPDALSVYCVDEDAEGYATVPAEANEEHGFQLSPAGESMQRFVTELVQAVTDRKAAIDAELAKHPHDWSYERIGTAERCLLRLAVAEMLYIGTAYRVVINEVLDLSKDYCPEDATPFINGILGAVVRDHEELRAPKASSFGGKEVSPNAKD